MVDEKQGEKGAISHKRSRPVLNPTDAAQRYELSKRETDYSRTGALIDKTVDNHSLNGIFSHLMEYCSIKGILMAWDIEYTNEFGGWWQELSEVRQDDITAIVETLMEKGP